MITITLIFIHYLFDGIQKCLIIVFRRDHHWLLKKIIIKKYLIVLSITIFPSDVKEIEILININ